MALLGISLIVASVVFFCFRPPAWLPGYFRAWQQARLGAPRPRPPIEAPPPTVEIVEAEDKDAPASGVEERHTQGQVRNRTRAQEDTDAMPPPPAVRKDAAAPIIPSTKGVSEDLEDTMGGPETEADQTTPKAKPALPADTIPTFSLSEEEPQPRDQYSARAFATTLPPSMPKGSPRASAATAAVAASSSLSPGRPNGNPGGLMAPPPRPPTLAPLASPASSSASLLGVPSRSSPLPNRGPPPSSSSSSLAPPPTHTTKPAKPSRKVLLTPGHSPLDWARLSSSPTENLNGLPPGSPYLRVTPSMLKRQTGRRGKDAWTVMGGRVYNVTPYLPFHPGGGPELLRGAGRDGTKLFGEVHPWVNYEGMLASCLVGIFVSEEEGAEVTSKMDEMD